MSIFFFRKLYEDNGEVFENAGASRHQYELVKDLLRGWCEYDDLVTHQSRIEKRHQEHIGQARKSCTARDTAEYPGCERKLHRPAEYFGPHVERIFDVGVSGIHRLISRLEVIQEANCVDAVAGREGALARMFSEVWWISRVMQKAVPDFCGIRSEHGHGLFATS